MAIKYQPQGILISSSLAISSSIAVNAVFLPPTASFAGFTLNPIGPTGSIYRIIQASVLPTSST
jgi:hypothetical protein